MLLFSFSAVFLNWSCFTFSFSQRGRKKLIFQHFCLHHSLVLIKYFHHGFHTWQNQSNSLATQGSSAFKPNFFPKCLSLWSNRNSQLQTRRATSSGHSDIGVNWWIIELSDHSSECFSLQFLPTYPCFLPLFLQSSSLSHLYPLIYMLRAYSLLQEAKANSN